MQDESQVVLVFVVSSLIILLIIILMILFVLAYQKRISNQRHALDQIEKEHQMHLLQATLEIQERERKRIASDLHDDIGSLLSALKLNVSFLEETIQDTKQQHFLKLTREKLESGIDQVRRISHDIYPPALERLGLWHALNDFLSGLNDSKKVSVVYENDCGALRPDAKTELAVYRVVQELTNNSLRHSQATEITVRVNQISHTIRLIYIDNGIGMDLDKVAGGLGFINMRSRIKAINGSIHFNSLPGSGCVATLTFKPLNYENEQNSNRTYG